MDFEVARQRHDSKTHQSSDIAVYILFEALTKVLELGELALEGSFPQHQTVAACSLWLAFIVHSPRAILQRIVVDAYKAAIPAEPDLIEASAE